MHSLLSGSAMEVKDWLKEGTPVEGRWEEVPLEVWKGRGENARLYRSDWTPKDLEGAPMPLTHTGKYLKVKVGGAWGYFHRQLYQDSR